MGDKGPDTDAFDASTAQASKAAALQAQMARELFGQVTPLRKDLLARYKASDPLAFSPVTMQNISRSPLYGALRSGVYDQFAQARENVFEDTPGTRFSGLLADNLTDLAGERANAMSTGLGAIAESEQARRMQLLGNATNFAAGQPATAIAGLGGASSAFGNIAGQQGYMADLQEQAAQKQGKQIGQAIGKIATGGKK